MTSAGPKTFLVESYVRQLDAAAAAAIARRFAAATADLQQRGAVVVWLRSIALLGEETYFGVFSAESIEQVAEAAEQAGVGVDHVGEVVAIEPR
jgi:hypothetical protein